MHQRTRIKIIRGSTGGRICVPFDGEWGRSRYWWAVTSVTRLGDLLHFGQLFKACGNNYFAQIAHFYGHFCKVVKIFHLLSSGIIFGQLL